MKRKEPVPSRKTIQKLLDDPNLLRRGIMQNCRVHRTCYQYAKAAIEMARKLAKPEFLEDLAREDKIKRLSRTLVKSTRKYPKLLPLSFRQSMSSVGRQYGISRERVRQVQDQFRRLSTMLDLTAKETWLHVKSLVPDHAASTGIDQ